MVTYFLCIGKNKDMVSVVNLSIMQADHTHPISKQKRSVCGFKVTLGITYSLVAGIGKDNISIFNTFKVVTYFL